MRTAQIAAAATFENLIAYSYAGAFYVAFVVLLQGSLKLAEQRLEKAYTSQV